MFRNDLRPDNYLELANVISSSLEEIYFKTWVLCWILKLDNNLGQRSNYSNERSQRIH